MTFEQLRVFVEVAERLHMTQAAAALNLTQSSASAAVQALEARLNMALFDRIGRRLELTDAGRVLFPEAKAVLAKALGAEHLPSFMASCAADCVYGPARPSPAIGCRHISISSMSHTRA